MKCYIIGAKRDMGTYQGRDYDNVKLRVVYPAEGEAVQKGLEFGQRVAEYKVKTTIFPLEKAFEVSEKNQPIEFFFDQYQNVALVNILKG